MFNFVELTQSNNFLKKIKILACLTPPISLDGQDIPVKISIGIAVSPNDSTDPRNLLAMADQAMYRAKDFGGQRWSFSTAEWNLG